MASIQLSSELISHFNISDYTYANHGGQKKVFIVTILGVKYALKIVNIADDRFEREVKICQEFSYNEGIPKINRIEQYKSDTIILEEYIDGKDLSELINAYKDNEQKVCNLIYKVGQILTPVWNSRYVHRDLKPQNIRIRESGEPVVLDFGIARALDEETITATGGQPLSWLFASPEQYAGKKDLISYRTDFFCLGIIAYYLFTNELPFGANKIEIENSFQAADLNVDTKNKLLNNFMGEVLKKNPSDRPRTIENFLKLIEIWK